MSSLRTRRIPEIASVLVDFPLLKDSATSSRSLRIRLRPFSVREFSSRLVSEFPGVWELDSGRDDSIVARVLASRDSEGECRDPQARKPSADLGPGLSP